ncbi:hypothetical protein CBW56_17045 [Denitratisoma oestradiolicum]|nr:hypothetical protein CBW56_17045 [Denitratisoma oestradiolicum]
MDVLIIQTTLLILLMRKAIETNYSLWYGNWFGRMFEPSGNEPEFSFVPYAVARYDHSIAETNNAL